MSRRFDVKFFLIATTLAGAITMTSAIWSDDQSAHKKVPAQV
jgi:hypothetical protein